MRETEGASPEAHDQSCLRWFAASFLGWRTRSPDLRQRLIKSLSTDDFDQAYHAWINVEIGTEKVLADLRLERDTFMRELSAAGAVETSPSVFYDIAHDVEVWRLQPEWFQAREALRDCKAWVEEQRAGFQRLHEALQAVERPNAWVSSEADLERFRVMSDLQGYIGNAAMEHALGTLAALDQRLEGYLQGWDSRYPVEPGRPPNKATQDLLHRLSETYERAGGRLTTTWTAGKNCPQSPFAKFLV